MLEKSLAIMDAFEEWVINNIGAGTCFIVAVICLVGLIVAWLMMRDEAVEIEELDKNTEIWHYKDRTIIVDLNSIEGHEAEKEEESND